jgi:GNAT superfamily N-acetyltransferase
MVTIRKATLDDLEILLSFEQGVIQSERPFDPTLKRSFTTYYNIPKLILSDESELIVAVNGEDVIGSGYARIELAKPYVDHTSHGYLGFMFVLPEFRGKGINKMILDTLSEWCASRNVFELKLEVYVQNTPAIKAYEKAGFEKLMVLMRKDISR